MNTSIIECECLVVGGGSAGFGAALASARSGVKTMLVEKNNGLGGTSCFAGVTGYCPVMGAGGIPEEFCRLLLQDRTKCGFTRANRHFSVPEKNIPPWPGCESIIDENATYEDTLSAHFEPTFAETYAKRRGMIFEPDYLNFTMQALLDEAGCQVLLARSVAEVQTNGGKIVAVILDDGTEIHAQHWIDCCGVLAQNSGCKIRFGRDSKADFNEPDAPDVVDGILNGVTRIFRITPSDTCAEIEEREMQCSWAPKYPALDASKYPNGDYNCNMLPTMKGAEYFELGEQKAKIETERRIKEYWQYLQTKFPEFRKYKIRYIFPEIGVRESIRVECKYMLNENDIINGMNSVPDDAIARCDHLMDLHGVSMRKVRTGCYTIPFRCLQPLAVDNMLVAGRIAGFSSLAASSCRLSRTMMYLGQAAGTAAAFAKEKGCNLSDINGKDLNLNGKF